MAEYINKTKIPWVKTDNPKGKYWDRIVCESTIKNMEPADVIERSKIDKAVKEIENLHGEYFAVMDNDYKTTHKRYLDPNEVIEILRNIGE